MSIRRKPLAPFPFTLKDGSRFIVTPPTQQAWAEVLDEAPGTNSVARLAVIRFVDRLEDHADSAAFGAARSKEREAFVDQHLDIETLRELGNAVAETLLTEQDRGN